MAKQRARRRPASSSIPAREPATDEAAERPEPAAERWLLLIHQIPPKPDYLRVKIGRRLQHIGAVAIKNSVYVLPPRPESYEDFRWIVGEIEDAGGEAFVSEASLGEGLSDETVRARFDAARNEEFGEILADARALAETAQSVAKSGSSVTRPPLDVARATVERELARLRRRHESIAARDFFGASEGRAVVTVLGEIDATIRRRDARPGARDAGKRVHGATWVTRRDVHVDRIASAWLIRRFIDPRPHFRFVGATRYAHRPGELRFDMFEAEYTHVGDACTFETLVAKFATGDRALREIGEIVHDVDCKDGKFGRDEAPGLIRMIAGIVALCPRDEDRLHRGGQLFDDLYAAFSAPTK